MSIRLGSFAVVFEWNSVSYGWTIQKWKYKQMTSWWHGTAYLGRLKVIW